jgi:non-specific serine/threonine protein kinase
MALLTQSDLAAIVRFNQAALDLARATGDAEGMAMALSNLAVHAAMTGGGEHAAALAEESLMRARATDDPWLIGSSLHVLGLAVRQRGDGERAISLFQESLALLRPVGDRWSMGFALLNLGGATQARGDYEVARCAYQEALTLAHELWDRRAMAMVIECLAEVAVAQDRPRQGARLMGAAEGLQDSSGASWPPSYVASRERTQTAICDALGEAVFTAAREEGRALPLEQAVAYALEPHDASSSEGE